MKYFETKKDSLEEVISKTINEDNRPSAKELEEAGGKYLKYSDLLLQKGRLMAKNQSTAMIDKEISKEMKKLGIKEATGDKESNIREALASENGGPQVSFFYDVGPQPFSDDQKKAAKLMVKIIKKQFRQLPNKLGVPYGRGTTVGLSAPNLRGNFSGGSIDLEGSIESHIAFQKELKKQMSNIKLYYGTPHIFSNMKFSDWDRRFPIKLTKYKVIEKGPNATFGIDNVYEKLDEDADAYEKFFKSALKKFGVDSPADFKDDAKKKEFFNYVDKNYKAKEEESDLEETTTKNVDETLDKIREANVEKQKSMRSILADIWKMNEGKSPFEKDEVEESLFGVMYDKFVKAAKSMSKDKFVKTYTGKQVMPGQTKSMGKKDLEDIWVDFNEEVEESRQLKDKEKEMMVVKNNKVIVIDKSDFKKYKAKGYIQAEDIEKSSKTATGKKPTKVEIEPEVK